MRPDTEFLDREPYYAALARAEEALGEKARAMDVSSPYSDYEIRWQLVTDGEVDDPADGWTGIIRTPGIWNTRRAEVSPAEAVERTLREHQETLGFVRIHAGSWREGPGWKS